MKRFRFSLAHLLTAALLVAVVSTLFVSFWPTPRNTITKLFGGRGGRETILHPEKVVASLLGPLPDSIFYDDAVASDFPVEAGPVEVSRADVKKVSKALLSPKSYAWEWAKACGFYPDRKLTFIRDSEQVDVLFYSECDVLYAYRNNELVGFEDFDKVSPIIDSVFKASFPDEDVTAKPN